MCCEFGGNLPVFCKSTCDLPVFCEFGVPAALRMTVPCSVCTSRSSRFANNVCCWASDVLLSTSYSKSSTPEVRRCLLVKYVPDFLLHRL